MARGIFDTYQVIIEDTNALGNRRQTIDTVYESIVTLILAADGYVAAQTPYTSWFPVVAEVSVSIVGIAFTRHWRSVVDRLKAVLSLRYKYLRQLEDNDVLKQIGAQIYQFEDTQIYKQREAGGKKSSRNLQSIFTTVFLLIPLVRAGLTALAASGLHLPLGPLFSGLVK